MFMFFVHSIESYFASLVKKLNDILVEWRSLVLDSSSSHDMADKEFSFLTSKEDRRLKKVASMPKR
jgi:hypothetical protein